MKLFALFLFLLFSASQLALTAPTSMSRSDVAEIIRKNSDLNEEQITDLIERLNQELGTDSDGRLAIEGVLYTSGLNAALFLDTDEWYMDASFVDSKTGKLVEIPDLYEVEFHNGGLKFELAYKWMFSFIPSGTTVHQLDGGVYGRGVGLTLEAFLGAEGAWMPADNRPGHLFHVAIKLGAGGGLSFPKMQFRKRTISKEP